MSTGELLVVRAAMKPLATLNVPMLETVDTATKESTVSFKERTDVTAVPAMGVVAETMVALVLAAEAQRKFGGDSVDEFVRNADGLPRHAPVTTPRRDERHIVLVGMMGAGKTTVGRRLAARLGRRLVDSDALIEARTGRTVRRDLRDRGRGGVPRARDGGAAEALGDAEPLVIAAAGGVVLREENRAALRRVGRSGRLAAGRPDVLAERATRGGHRPLLDDDPAGSHAPAAARARAAVPRGRRRRRRHRRPVAERRRRRASSSWPVDDVAPGARCRSASASYDVVVGHGAVAALRTSAAGDGPPGGDRHAGRRSRSPSTSRLADAALRDRRRRGSTSRWPRRGADAAASPAFGLTRNDVVIGVGGGMVTDVAGFAAAIVAPRRPGRPRRHDAARHGRRGDRRQDRRQPAGGQEPRRRVLAAVRRDLRPRRARHAARRASAAPATARWRSTTSSPATTSTPWTSPTRVARCVEIKAEFVAADEREGGRRALLNYGHTLAHALEIATGHRPDARRGGRDRPRVRRRAGPAARAHRRRAGRRAPGGRRRDVRAADDGARRAVDPTSSSP